MLSISRHCTPKCIARVNQLYCCIRQPSSSGCVHLQDSTQSRQCSDSLFMYRSHFPCVQSNPVDRCTFLNFLQSVKPMCVEGCRCCLLSTLISVEGCLIDHNCEKGFRPTAIQSSFFLWKMSAYLRNVEPRTTYPYQLLYFITKARPCSAALFL